MPHLGKFFLPCSCFRSLWETQKYPASLETFTNLEEAISIKLQSKSSRQIWRQAPGISLNITCNRIGPSKLLQFIWLDNSNREVIWYHFTAVKWYHITSRVSFLVMHLALSHWYPHIICNKTRVEHEKIKFISTSGHVIFCLLYKYTNNDVFDDFPKISDHFQKISEDFPKMFRRRDERLRTFFEHFPKIGEDCRR